VTRSSGRISKCPVVCRSPLDWQIYPIAPCDVIYRIQFEPSMAGRQVSGCKASKSNILWWCVAPHGIYVPNSRANLVASGRGCSKLYPASSMPKLIPQLSTWMSFAVLEVNQSIAQFPAVSLPSPRTHPSKAELRLKQFAAL
jgi:hypothetical protein